MRLRIRLSETASIGTATSIRLLSLSLLGALAGGWAASGFSPWGLAPLAAGAALAGAALRGLREDTRVLAQVESVLEEARQGRLEARVVLVPRGHRLARATDGLNDVLDQVEAVLRESLTVVSRMTKAGGGDSVREPQTAGLRGLFAVGLGSIGEVQRRMDRTIFTLRDVMKAMAGGEFKRTIDAQSEAGELRLILLTAQQAISSLDGILEEVVTVLARMAKGDLTPRVLAEGQGSLARLRTDINQALDSLAGSMQTIARSAQQVASASGDASHAVSQIADGAQSQTLAVDQVAGAVRQAANAIADISRNTEEASQVSRQSVQAVRRSIQRMEDMVEVVTRIAANSEQIDKITGVIEKIANKTNLLSLNAAIEAARAGEHGKGFSVVADEVGKLAQSSAESSKEIAALVHMAVFETQQAVKAVLQVREEMNQIDVGSARTDTMLQRIASSVEQQSAAIDAINANLDSVNRIARSNASAAEQITVTVIELAKIAGSTRNEVAKFSY
ncbi:methyl-accepting chemotaxis protein [Ramlibacter sp. MAHUQ-53]|uniref:methyl-accepting chemotaxis protein n=1 Tax=unclassified Ramlibacter TaxID=2617605 RepID=UPI0036369DF6